MTDRIFLSCTCIMYYMNSFIILAVDCGKPVSITNGDVSYPSTIIDSLATYNCNDGYTLVGGDATVKCNENGDWEGPLPACVGMLLLQIIIFITKKQNE